MQTKQCMEDGEGGKGSCAASSPTRLPHEGLLQQLKLYRDHGVRPKHFLLCVLRSDLRGACRTGTEEERRQIPDLVGYCEDRLPIAAWGSPAIVDRWLARHRSPGAHTELPSFIEKHFHR